MVVSKDAKRKRKEIIETSPEMPKRTKVQAQRKFAQGQYPPPSTYSCVGASSSSTSATAAAAAAAAGNSQQPPTDANREPPPELIKQRPKTDDFLTFLCYRGSNALPPHLDFLNDNKKKNETKTNTKTDLNKTSDKHKDNGPSTSKASTPSTSKNETNNISDKMNENKVVSKSITTPKKGKNSTNLNSTEIMPFAVRKRAEQISEGNKKLKNVAVNMKNKSAKDTERRSLRGRPRINFEEHDEDEFNGDFDEAVPDETNKNLLNNKTDGIKNKKKIGNKKLIENNTETKKEIIEDDKKKDAIQLEMEVKKSPGKRGPKPKIKDAKSESNSSKKLAKEQTPVPVAVQQETDIGSGRMTRQRAFFEPVKVPVRQSSVEKDKVSPNPMDADVEKIDFSSDDEKPLKSVKANGKKKPGRKSNSPNKVSPKKQNIKQDKIKQSDNTNESNLKTESEVCKTSVNPPIVVKAKGRPRLKIQPAEKETTTSDDANQTNIKNIKATVKKNNQQKTNCIESGDEESIDKITTETPSAIITETPSKKKRGRKRGADADISQQSQTDLSENETARTGRPTRKTKEAATIYMELIGQKLHDFDDEDSFSMDSFPELPNVREMEKVENELKKNVGKQKTVSPLNKTNIENKKEEKVFLPKTVSPLSVKKRGPKKKAAVAPVMKKPKVEKKLTKKQQKLNAEIAKTSNKEEDGIEDDEDDILLKEEVKETKRKLEKSFSDSDDEPLAIKVTKTSEKDFDMPKDNEPKTNGETTKSMLKAPLLQQPQSPQATSTPNNTKWVQLESSSGTLSQAQKLQLITAPSLIVPPKITTASSSTTKSQQQVNSLPSKHISTSNNFLTPSPVHIDTYPSPKINPTFLTPKFDRNLERRVVTAPSLATPDSPSVTSFNAQKNNSSFPLVASAGVAIAANSSNKLSNATQNFAFSNSFNINTTNPAELGTPQQQNIKSNSPAALAGSGGVVITPGAAGTTAGGAAVVSGGGGDANSPNAIANLLAANLMPSKEESGKIFGIASVSLAQSSGPDNTKCTLGKCGSIHKPVLGPVVPTESYLGEQQLSSKERRKAKVNMTHEQIQKWLIECSSSPDQIQDDLDDDFDEVLRPATFAPTPPPLFRDDPALSGINLLSKAAASLKELPSLGANAGKTTPTQKEANTNLAGKGPLLKTTPLVKDADHDSLKQDVDEESASEKKSNLTKKVVKKKLEKKEQLKEKQDQLREKLDAKEKENQEKLKAKIELMEKEKAEKLRLEKEKIEQIEKERVEKERSECLEKEKQEKERLEKETQEKERIEKEKIEKEKLDKQTKQKEKKEKTKPNIAIKKVAKTPMKKTTQKSQLKFEKQLQKVVAKTTPTKLKRTPVYTSKQQCNSKSENLNNTFGAFSPDNEKSVYSFDKEDDDILVPLSKPFRRQSRRDSHNEDEAKKVIDKQEPVNKSSSVTLSTSENSKLIKMNLPAESSPEPTTSKRKPKMATASVPSALIKDTKSTTSEFVLNDSEGETFYIPLQGTDVAGLAGQAVEVKVKVGREGPDGPNQKVCVQATLVTKSQFSTAAQSTSVENEKTNVTVNKDSPKTRVKNEAGSSRTLQRVNSNSSLFSGSNKSRGTPSVPANVPKKLKDDTPIKICNNTAFPHRDDPSQMVEAPVFRPTEKEFHDPMEFIDRITPIAARFGICKIIPPASFKPECRVSDDMRFSAYNQYVHKMLYRWGPSVKELNAIKKHCTTQRVSLTPFPLIGQIEVDLPRLYHTVQELGGLQEVMEKKKWNRVADEMCIPKLTQDCATRLDDIYCKYLLPYDTLSTTERQKLFDEVEADWAKREARARRNADHCLNSETDSNEEEEDEIESSEDSDEDPADGVSMECIVKGKTMPLKQFFRIARNQMSLWFKNTEPTTGEVEAEFWRHVAVRDSHVCVHSGSIDSSGWGYGFPIPKGKGSPCARHAWNLKVLTNNQGSVLRSLGPVMGVTVPTLHVGMLFSACCWYRDPHGLSWIEYLHTGASKIWYGIPDEQSSNFRKALTQLIPTHCQNKTIWLPCDTVMVPPHMLTDRGVSLCRIEQKPGEFVVIFPRAYTSSLSTGYVVSESVYFATSSWLDLAKEDFKDIHDSCEPAMFSLEQLLFAVASDARVSVDILTQCLPMLEEVIAKEEAAREQLKATGVKSMEKLSNNSVKNNKSKKKLPQFTDDDNECDLCRANLYISMIKTNDNNIYCLQHALKNLNKGNILADQCKLIYTYSIKDIQDLIKNVKNRLTQKNKSISHTTGKKK